MKEKRVRKNYTQKSSWNKFVEPIRFKDLISKIIVDNNTLPEIIKIFNEYKLNCEVVVKK